MTLIANDTKLCLWGTWNQILEPAGRPKGPSCMLGGVTLAWLCYACGRSPHSTFPQTFTATPWLKHPLRLLPVHRKRLSVDSLVQIPALLPPPLHALGAQWSRTAWKQKVPEYHPYLQQWFCGARAFYGPGGEAQKSLWANTYKFTFYTFWHHLFLPSTSHMSSFFKGSSCDSSTHPLRF